MDSIDRLTEYVCEAMAKDCGSDCRIPSGQYCSACRKIATYLIKERGIIVAPCKFGDTAYEATSNAPDNIMESKVVAITAYANGRFDVETAYSCPMRRELGHMVHLTKEAAMLKLNQRGDSNGV